MKRYEIYVINSARITTANGIIEERERERERERDGNNNMQIDGIGFNVLTRCSIRIYSRFSSLFIIINTRIACMMISQHQICQHDNQTDSLDTVGDSCCLSGCSLLLNLTIIAKHVSILHGYPTFSVTACLRT